MAVWRASRGIAADSRQQSDAIGQVNRALARIDRATQRNVDVAGQAEAAVRSLEGQAAALVESVGIFRLAPDYEPAAPRDGNEKGREDAALPLPVDDVTAAAR